MANVQTRQDFHYRDTPEPGLVATEDARVPTPRSSDELEWELLRQLQTSLDVGRLVEIFFRHLKERTPCDHVAYRYPEGEVELHVGKPARHSCVYNLTLSETSIGELTFTRQTKFGEDELVALERMLCLLVFPLRNALLYREAVQTSLRDPLTGILNRAAMDELLAKEVESAHRHRTPLSMIVLDVDNFKSINDNFGHAVGDYALKTLARSLLAQIRRSDVLFRYGGEEFTVLLSNTGLEGAEILAERIRNAVQSTVCVCEDVRMQFTVSLGVATLAPGEEPKQFFDKTDRALYAAKSHGRNCVIAADPELPGAAISESD